MYSKTIQKREYHLGLLMLLAIACVQCLPTGTSLRPVKALWNFDQIAGYPALAFLFGSLSREVINTRERLVRFSMAFAGLYLVQKLLLFWIQAALGGTPGFALFNTPGASWLFLVFAEYLLLMLWLEQTKWDRRLLVVLTLAVGCLSGLLGWIGDRFCLARALVFLPLFLLGRWTDAQQRGLLLDKIETKLISLAGLAAVLAVCWWKSDFLYRLAAFFKGNKSYASLSSGIIGHYGPLVRLGWYVLVLCLIFGLLALMPNRRLPAITDLSESWPEAYLWQRPVTILFSTVLMDLFSDRLGKLGYLAGLALALMLVVIACLPWAVRPVKWVLRNGNFWNPPNPPARTLHPGRQSFYQRHTLGVRCVLIFTAAFVVLATAVVLPFYTNGKSMVWTVDGLQQQYASMVFLRNYALSVVEELRTTGVLHLPQFTFEAGMGMDVLDVIRRDPLMLLCLFTPVDCMEALYNVLCMLRIYCSGLAVMWLLLEMGRTSKMEVVCGGASYAFCGYSLYILVRQPVFQTPCLIYLPLMLAGVERFLHKRKGGLFLVTVCLNFISGYYLAYMNTLMMALYLLVRLIFLHGTDVKRIVSEIFKLIGVYFWGMALSGVILLPTVYSFLTSSRSGEQSGLTSLFAYSWNYYEKLFDDLTAAVPSGQSWAILSFAGLTLLAIVLLFFQKEKRFRPLKTGVIICTVMICVPLFGKIMNGFGYVTNRWCYGFALMGSLVLAYLLPEFLHLEAREKRGLLVAGGIYIGLVLCGQEPDAARYVGLLLLAATLLAVLTMDLFASNTYQKKTLLSLTLILTLAVNSNAAFRSGVGDYTDSCVEAGEVQSSLTDTAAAAAAALEDDSFYRVEQSARRSNQAMAVGYYGTTSYYSVIPSGLTETYLEFNLNTAAQSFDLRGFDARASLEALACVKYYCVEAEDEGERVPYGFSLAEESDGVLIYENQYALSLGYTYTSYMTESEYSTLNFAEKQQAVLQNAVVSDETAQLLDEAGLTEGETDLTVQEVDCQVAETHGLTLDEETKTITVTEENASITFTFDGAAGCETYLYLEGINYASDKTSDLCELKVRANGTTTTTRLHGKRQTYYFETSGFSFNLGYSQEGTAECTLIFTEAGEFTYEDFRVFCLPMEDYVEDVTALRQEMLENVEEDGDSVTGSISASSTRLLTFSIPYTRGWTLWVDGEETELFQVDKLYMGAVIEAGDHEIVLKYAMPWLNVGMAASGAALAAIAVRGVCVLLLRRRGGAARAKRKEKN
ncbi:MAG: YfhO family protein [Clostridiales bacterium]|nr:YfhO family protein [Clostridiales bacterium]